MNVDQWMRLFACQSLGAVSDTYNVSHPHNLKLYVRPDDHKIDPLPWDTDRAFSNSATSSVYGSSGSQLQKVLAIPAYKRLFQEHLYDIITTTYDTDYLSEWVTYYAAQSGQNATARILSLIDKRRSYVLSQLPAEVPFAIMSSHRNPNRSVTLTGQAWIDVADIRLHGEEESLAPTWTTTTQWSIALALPANTGEITLDAYDKDNQLLDSQTQTIP